MRTSPGSILSGNFLLFHFHCHCTHPVPRVNSLPVALCNAETAKRKWKLIFLHPRSAQGDHKLSSIPFYFRVGSGRGKNIKINKCFSPFARLRVTFACWIFAYIYFYLLNAHVHFAAFIHKFKHFFIPELYALPFLSRAKFVPDFQPTEEVAHPALSTHPDVPPDEKFSPPTPEEAERIISHLLPRWVELPERERRILDYKLLCRGAQMKNHSNFPVAELWFPYQPSLPRFLAFRPSFINVTEKFYDATRRRCRNYVIVTRALQSNVQDFIQFRLMSIVKLRIKWNEISLESLFG